MIFLKTLTGCKSYNFCFVKIIKQRFRTKFLIFTFAVQTITVQNIKLILLSGTVTFTRGPDPACLPDVNIPSLQYLTFLN